MAAASVMRARIIERTCKRKPDYVFYGKCTNTKYRVSNIIMSWQKSLFLHYFKKLLLNKLKGKESLTITQKLLNSKPYAASLFHEVYGRLRDVNHWQRYAGPATAHFQLTDNSGTEVYREAQEGDCFQIDIPGHASAAGGGDDWVKVQRTGHEKSGTEEIAYMIVKTTTNPLALNTETAHFF